MKFAAVFVVFSFVVVVLGGEGTCPDKVQTAINTCFKTCRPTLAQGQAAVCSCLATEARNQADLGAYVSECDAETSATTGAAYCDCLKGKMDANNCHPKLS